MKKWALTSIVVFCVAFSNFARVIPLEESIKEYKLLSNEIEIFEDPSNKITFKEILSNPNAYRFRNYQESEQYSKHVFNTYWIRFSLKNNTGGSPGKWVLEILDSRFEEVVFYSPDVSKPTEYHKSKTGTKYPFVNREYEHKNFVFDVPVIADKEVHYYYLKIKPGLVGSFLMKIRQNKVFASYATKEHLLLGMYYGILFIMAFYNLFIYFSLKEKVYIYYFFYVLAWALNSSFDDGLGFQYVWSSFPSVSEFSYYVANISLIAFYLVYSKSFLTVKDNTLFTSKILYIALVSYTMLSVTFIYYNLTLFINLLFTFTYGYVLFISVIIYKAGYKPARFFIVGNGIIVLGLIVYMLKNAGVFDALISDYPFALTVMVYIRNIIMVEDIVILSVALADRIRFFKQSAEEAQKEIIYQLYEKKQLGERVNRELEEKVKERTKTIEDRTRIIEEKKHELEEANKKLKEQAEEINKMNALLDIDNWNLKKNIIQEKEARIVLKEINYAEFSQVYPTESACNMFIEEVKWAKEFTCRKCGFKKYGKGVDAFSRRCSNCRYDESVTAYTIFHRCRFEIKIALYMAVMVNRYGKNISIADISREVNLRNATCWKFIQKLFLATESKEYKQANENDKLKVLILNNP